MDTALLNAFVMIAETGSISSAAERLFVTQPAVSKRLKQLEQMLDSQLIDRSGRYLKLTQTGTALLPRARNLLSDLSSLKQVIADLEGNPMGKLTMATSHHIGLHYLPKILRGFRKNYPDVELELDFMDSEEACQRVSKSEVDLAVVTLPIEYTDRLNFTPVWHDQLVICCDPQHPLASIQYPTIQDLTEHQAVLPAHGTFTRTAIEKALSNCISRVPIALETNYLETIKMMVSVGLGWSVLPRNMLGETFKIIAIKGFEARRTLGIVTNPQRTPSRAFEAMTLLIRHSA